MNKLYNQWHWERKFLESGKDRKIVSDYFHFFYDNLEKAYPWFEMGFVRPASIKHLMNHLDPQEAYRIKEEYISLGMKEEEAEDFLSYYPKLGDLSQFYKDGWRDPSRLSFPLPTSSYRKLNEVVEHFKQEDISKEEVLNLLEAIGVVDYILDKGKTLVRIDRELLDLLKQKRKELNISNLYLLRFIMNNPTSLELAKERISLYTKLGLSVEKAEAWVWVEMEQGIYLEEGAIRKFLKLGLTDPKKAFRWSSYLSFKKIEEFYSPDVEPEQVVPLEHLNREKVKRILKLGIPVRNYVEYLLFSVHEDTIMQLVMPYEQRFEWIKKDGELVDRYVRLGVRSLTLKKELENLGYNIDFLEDFIKVYPMDKILYYALLKGYTAERLTKQYLQEGAMKSFRFRL